MVLSTLIYTVNNIFSRILKFNIFFLILLRLKQYCTEVRLLYIMYIILNNTRQGWLVIYEFLLFLLFILKSVLN